MTSREEALLAEIADLVETIQDHVERMVAIKRIQELEVDNVLMRVRKLMEKSAVLKYVHLEEQAVLEQKAAAAEAAEAEAPAVESAPEPDTVRAQMEAALQASQEALAMAQSFTAPAAEPEPPTEEAVAPAEQTPEPVAEAPEPAEEVIAPAPVAETPEAAEEELPPMPASVAEAAPLPESVPEFVEATSEDAEPEFDEVAFAEQAAAADTTWSAPVEAEEQVVEVAEPEAPAQEQPEAEHEASATEPVPQTTSFGGLNFGMPAASEPDSDAADEVVDTPAADEPNAPEPVSEEESSPEPAVNMQTLQDDYRSLDAAGDGVSVNERMAAPSGGDLASKMQRQPITDLKASIGLNEKFQFINELFGGNAEAFNLAVEEFNNLSGMAEAQELLNARGLNQSNPEALQSFTELLERRYA